MTENYSDGIGRLTQRSGTSKLPLRRAIIDEQFNSFAGGQIIDEQAELITTRKRTDAGSRGLFVGAFTDEFDRPGIVGAKFDRPHGFGYHVTGHCSLPLDGTLGTEYCTLQQRIARSGVS